MTYCRSCGEDVHITHDDEDCPAGEADRVHGEEGDE